MLKWSKYFQNPEYLLLYRTMTLHPDLRNLISIWIGLKDNMKVLDVGCGTGAFIYYLAKGTKKCHYYGIDIDSIFIKKANELIVDNNNYYKFILGDAIKLPFPDEFFDIVTSYTFLTNMPNGKSALNEMKRVVKKNGTVSSITAQNFDKISFDGEYPILYSNYYFEYKTLRREIEDLYENIQPSSDYVKYGTSPQKIPILYVDCGFHNIKMYPLGWGYSLSNSVQSKREKEQFIKLFFIAEKNKFEAFMELPEFNRKISLQKYNRYLKLLELHKDALLSSIGENKIWEWQGGSQLLIIANK